MHSAGPMTFGARLARHQVAPEEAVWFFNVPYDTQDGGVSEQAESGEADDGVQIGPLDV